jgi:diketogulonate reductase-like aldo/keto reductase
MLEFLLGTAVVIIAALGYACWNMLQKNETLENAINIYHARTWAAVREMRMLDSREIFENDDEVGSVFKQLVECVEELDAFVTETVDGDTTNEETE